MRRKIPWDRVYRSNSCLGTFSTVSGGFSLLFRRHSYPAILCFVCATRSVTSLPVLPTIKRPDWIFNQSERQSQINQIRCQIQSNQSDIWSAVKYPYLISVSYRQGTLSLQLEAPMLSVPCANSRPTPLIFGGAFMFREIDKAEALYDGI